MAFADYASFLKGWVPELDLLLAQQLVNRAWKDIREARLWSWQRGVGVLFAPQNITSGNVTVTQFSTNVTLNSAATTALTNINNPLLTLRQFRAAQGPIYNIKSLAGSTLTLDRPYLEGSGAGLPYQCYRCYYTPADLSGNPVTDFKLWKAILNPIEGYAIVGQNLNLTRQELDARDPTRGSQDLAYAVAAYDVDANGNQRYELWPHPTSQRGYIALYIKTGVDLSATVDIPATFSKEVLLQRSLYYAYDWAIANQGRFASLRGVDFRLLKAENLRAYEDPRTGKGMLNDARRRDDNIALDSYIPNLRDYLSMPPIDSKFFQSHDISGWFQS